MWQRKSCLSFPSCSPVKLLLPPALRSADNRAASGPRRVAGAASTRAPIRPVREKGPLPDKVLLCVELVDELVDELVLELVFEQIEELLLDVVVAGAWVMLHT